MRRNLFILFTLTVFCQISCNSQTVKNRSRIIQPDSCVVAFWGDSIANVVFSTAKVNYYTLKPLEVSADPSKTVGGFVVDQKLGSIANRDYTVLQFLLQDSANYKNDGRKNKCPFLPYLAVEFVDKKEKAVLLLAFNCEAWAIVYNGEERRAEYNCKRQLLLFARALLPNDKHIDALINNLNKHDNNEQN